MATKKKAAPKKVVKKAAPKKAVKKAAPKKVVKKAAPKKVAPKKKAAPKKIKAIATKADFIEQLKNVVISAELSNKTAEEVFNKVFEILAISIKSKKRFSVPNFGTFNVKERKARTGRNPQTGAKIKIKKSKTVTFKPTPKLKGNL